MNASKAIVEARKLTGFTQAEAAEKLGISRATYFLRETNPGDFRLSELKKLFQSMNSESRSLLVSAVGHYLCEKP